MDSTRGVLSFSGFSWEDSFSSVSEEMGEGDVEKI